ncbi:chromobox protein homolog 1-like isoform X3 [Spodoptera frugiperda]|uniref:Chromobox protein homolog 1-like isoform X1 n=2 Tax=Spodoptera frugiperda TaxID=7108 RepID=A0A9R0EMT7_SPOFR|nr:chromobox protein homolog 1-like isoform X1 [Spodoptera frugiperda]XP_050563974.1 chromobox protein homolog 1-like isoform X3 [Spodoptera frugiperda]
MRKISKSRTDDDVVSSTNGSVVNEEHSTDAERQADPDEKEPESESTDNVEINESVSTSSIKESSKKGKAKNKTKKKKSEKKVTEEEYEVEKIVDSKRIKGKLHYLIRWKGYSADNDTWEPENTLSCPELINKYNDEKENSKTKESKAEKKNNKRKAKKAPKTPAKRAKHDLDDSNADENAEYEVDRILEVRHKKNGQREFFIHWKGWSSKFDSWEPEDNLNCPELIKKFMEKVSKARSVDSRNLRVAPETTNRFTLQDPSSGRRLSKRRGQRQRVRYDNAE